MARDVKECWNERYYGVGVEENRRTVHPIESVKTKYDPLRV